MIAIVMVTYRKVEYARMVIGNICACMTPGMKLFVVDNNSGPEMLELLNTVAAWAKDRVEITGCRKNIGKANAVNLLVGMHNLLERYDRLVFMDPDIIFGAADLSALIECLGDVENPGMIAMDYYPWNSPKPKHGSRVFVPGRSGKTYGMTVHPSGDQTAGFVAGGVFGVTAETVRSCLNGRIYPETPYVYFNEDAALDLELRRQGRRNGYLSGTEAVHLPELDLKYFDWKNKSRGLKDPPTVGYYDNS